MRHGVGAHRAGEHQQHRREDGGLHHGQRDPEHGFPLGRVENGGGFLKVGVHVAENAADEDVGEGGVVQAEDDDAREQALAPPHGHLNAQRRGEQAVGGAGDGVGVEDVLPDDGERPLGHDVGEDEDGAEVFLPREIGARDEEGEEPAVDDRHEAAAYRQEYRVPQRRPEVGLCDVAGKEVYVVDYGIALAFAGEVRVYGAGVDFKGVLHNGHNGRHGGDGQDDAQEQEYDVVRL